MEDIAYNEYINSLSKKQRNLLDNGYASIKQWGENDFEFVLECEPSNEQNTQKKFRNNDAQKAAMQKKQKAARRKKNKMRK